MIKEIIIKLNHRDLDLLLNISGFVAGSLGSVVTMSADSVTWAGKKDYCLDINFTEKEIHIDAGELDDKTYFAICGLGSSHDYEIIDCCWGLDD